MTVQEFPAFRADPQPTQLSSIVSREPPVKTDDRFLRSEHRRNDYDECQHPVYRSGERNVVTEHEVDGTQHYELRTEQDEPGGEKTEEPGHAARPGIEITGDLVFECQRGLEQDLQKNGGQDGYRERVDRDMPPILVEQV